VSTETGALRIDAGRDLVMEREGVTVGPHNTQIFSGSGSVSTETGALRIDAGRDLVMEREGVTVGPHNTQIF
ncbi:hypothetical protein CNY89_30165, partial [Amaricoccus sp. HAR-UPW-R2A-40]